MSASVYPLIGKAEPDLGPILPLTFRGKQGKKSKKVQKDSFLQYVSYYHGSLAEGEGQVQLTSSYYLRSAAFIFENIIYLIF